MPANCKMPSIPRCIGYVVNGVAHWANASDPQIPAALTPVVAGISTLHTFRKAPQIARMQAQVAKGDEQRPAI